MTPAERNPSETILVVDDEDGVRRFVCSVLRQLSYTVLEAGSGLEALRVYQDRPLRIHLLLTNIYMPGMNGTELAERVTAQWPWTLVLYMSGGVEMSLFGDFASKSERAFLPKPFKVETLRRKVREVLDAGWGTP